MTDVNKPKGRKVAEKPRSSLFKKKVVEKKEKDGCKILYRFFVICDSFKKIMCPGP